MPDNDFSTDMWFYFYENMKKNKQYSKYYVYGINDMLDEVISVYNVSEYEYLLILLINDINYIPKKDILDVIVSPLYITYVNNEDYYKWIKLIMKSQKFRIFIDIFNFCVNFADIHIYNISVYIATNYLNEDDFIEFKNRYRNSISINLLLYSNVKYTMNEYYEELRSILRYMTSSSIYIHDNIFGKKINVIAVNHIINKFSETYAINKKIKWDRVWEYTFFIPDIMSSCKYKYKIKNIISEYNNQLLNSEIIEYQK